MTSPAFPDPEPPPQPPLRLRTGLRRATGFLWWLPIAIAAIAAAVVYSATTAQPDIFRAEANLLAPATSPVPPETYAALVTSTDVLRATIDALRIPDTVSTLRDSVSADTQGTLIRIRVTHAATPDDATLLARTLANVIMRDAPTLLAGAPAPQPLGTPDPTAERVGPKTARNTAIAIAAGLVFGAILTAGLAFRERPVQRPLEVEWLTGLPTLAGIPRPRATHRGAHRSDAVHHHDETPILLTHPHSEEAEAYRTLRTMLDSERADHALRTILVTGAEPGVGASSVAANLAIAFADAGHPTLLVDADLRQPAIHRLFDLANAHGLSDALVSETPQALIPPVAAEASLQVMTSGPLPDHPAELLGSASMAEVIRLLAETAALVVIDTPPLSAAPDAALLAPHCDGALLVIDSTHTHADALTTAARTLRAARAPLLGVVLTHARGHTADPRYAPYFPDDPAPADATTPDSRFDYPQHND